MSKRLQAMAWLEKWAVEAGGNLDDLLNKLADFSLGNGRTFVYKNKVVGIYEGEEGEESEEATFKPGVDSGWELDERGWTSDSGNPLFTHYKTFTGVSPWDKDCRGC